MVASADRAIHRAAGEASAGRRGAAKTGRQTMRRVLVPVDGSDCSLRAVAYVVGDRARCATTDGYEVHLLNVQAPLPRDVTQFVGHAQVADFHRAESERALQPAEAVLVKAGVPFTSHAEVGHLGETIAQRADDLACDLIVMGAHGRGALAELLVGSIATRVIHLAHVPVLLVK
jgi:nucleotide-binding universal stress UspA family protein